jgi:hypothetical protein
MKILIVVDTELVVRHFIHTGALNRLQPGNDVVYVFPQKGHKRLGTVDPETLDLAGARRMCLPVHTERLQLWRYRFFVERLRGWASAPAAHLASMREMFRIGNRWHVYILFRVLGLPGVFPIFTRYVNHRLVQTPNEQLDKLLAEEQPDVIVHPSVIEGLYINDLVEAGNRLGIPVVVIMNSWDNPASKRAVVGTDYWLLVWGPQTHHHALKLMNMPPERVVTAGAAQFDVYAEPPAISRSELLADHGLDPSRPVILYAGSSKGTDEFEHLNHIQRAIDAGELPPVSIIYRPHPWGGGGVDGGRFLKHEWGNVVIETSMRSYLERVAAGHDESSLPPYGRTRDLLSAVDIVASPLSTILIEGMLLGKPVLCFMPVEESQATHFQLAAGQVHFAELLSAPEVVVAWSRDTLITGLAETLQRARTPGYGERARECAKFFVEPFAQPFRDRIGPLLQRIVSNYEQPHD